MLGQDMCNNIRKEVPNPYFQVGIIWTATAIKILKQKVNGQGHKVIMAYKSRTKRHTG